MNNNVLILSAGRRVELVRGFQEAARRNSLAIHIYAADMNPEYSAACFAADKYFILPRVKSTDYLRELERLCFREDIGIVIPTIDNELYILARASAAFARRGIRLLVADRALVNASRDKRRTGDVFRSLDIGYPSIYTRDSIEFPCFSKPYDGSAGLGATVIASAHDFAIKRQSGEKIIFMELVGSDFVEFTIDAYYDRLGALKCLVPRERLEVRSGEVSKGATRGGRIYQYLRSRLAGIKGARGCVTVQVFFNPATEEVKGLEINPRFGGGFPLSLAAGADFPAWILVEYLQNKDIPFFTGWEEDLLMLRYDAKVLRRDS